MATNKVSDASFEADVLESDDARRWSISGPNGAAPAR